MRAINLLTLLAFGLSNFLTPAQASALADNSISPAESDRHTAGRSSAGRVEDALAKKFTPPSELGTVVDAYIPNNRITESPNHPPLVIHIQDLHANYSVQSNIAKLLDFLDSKLGAGNYKVAIEGAQGPLTVAELGKIQDKNFKMKVCDALMKEAELTGTEYFSIVNGKTDVLWGVEDERYHKANIELFQKTYEGKQQIVKSLSKVEKELGPIKAKYYDRTLRKLDKKEADLAAGKISMGDYLRFIAHFATKHGVDIARSYPEVAKETGFAASEKYPNVDKLLTEKQALAAEVRQLLAKNDVQRNLAQVEKEISLFKRFMNEQVTTQEVRDIAPRLSEIAGHAKVLLDSVHTGYDQKNLSELVSAGLDYYVIALARDKFLTENALKLFNSSPALPLSRSPKAVVLVAGGFHTPGITKLLKEKAVSYITLTPNVKEQTDRDRQLYIARLMDQHGDAATFAATLNNHMLMWDANGGSAHIAAEDVEAAAVGNGAVRAVAQAVEAATPAPNPFFVSPEALPASMSHVGGVMSLHAPKLAAFTEGALGDGTKGRKTAIQAAIDQASKWIAEAPSRGPAPEDGSVAKFGPKVAAARSLLQELINDLDGSDEVVSIENVNAKWGALFPGNGDLRESDIQKAHDNAMSLWRLTYHVPGIEWRAQRKSELAGHGQIPYSWVMNWEHPLKSYRSILNGLILFGKEVFHAISALPLFLKIDWKKSTFIGKSQAAVVLKDKEHQHPFLLRARYFLFVLADPLFSLASAIALIYMTFFGLHNVVGQTLASVITLPLSYYLVASIFHGTLDLQELGLVLSGRPLGELAFAGNAGGAADAYKEEALRRLGLKAAVPLRFLNNVRYRLGQAGRRPILDAKGLQTLVANTSGISLTGIETVSIEPYFRAATANPDEAFKDALPQRKLAVLGPMRVAIALLLTGFAGSAIGLDTKSAAGEAEQITLKDGADLISEGVLNRAAEDLGVQLKYDINENKGEVSGSVQTGFVGGDLAGIPTHVVVDSLEGTGAFVSPNGRSKGGSSSLYLQSSKPETSLMGQFPDTARALMVAANFDHARVPALIEEVNAERKTFGESPISTVKELLDPDLDPDVLIRRIARLNGVTPNEIDVSVLPNEDGAGGLYEVKNLERLKEEHGNMGINVLSAGTVRPTVAALLGVKGNRVKVFLGRSGMTEAVWSLGFANAMQDQGAYAGFRVVSEKIKKNRKQGLLALFLDVVRYALFESRPDDWKEITRREKIFSSTEDVLGSPEGSYTIVTDNPQDNQWPMEVSGATYEGSSNYSVYQLEFKKGAIRMIKGQLHAELPLPGEDAAPTPPVLHATERSPLPRLVDLLKIPRIASLLNPGFKPAIPVNILNLPGPDFLKRRYKDVPEKVTPFQEEMDLRKLSEPLVALAPEAAKASIIRNLFRIFANGNLGGTGYLSILPVDQDIEHSMTTFTGNPEYADPINLMRLAIKSGTNAIALSLGAMRVVSSKAPELMKDMPIIAKINHGQLLSAPNKARQRFYGGTPEQSVDQAYVAGATAIGITIYYGLPEEEFAEELDAGSRAAARAHELGLPVVIWSYLRNPTFKTKDGDMHTAADLTSQANRMAVATGAEIVKQKLPERDGGFKAVGIGQQDANFYSELTTLHPIDLARDQVFGNYAGEVPLINSGGAATGKGFLADAGDAVYTALVNRLAGGTGLIMGRKAFQKEMPEGSYLIKLIQAVYLLPTPADKLSPKQKELLEEVGGGLEAYQGKTAVAANKPWRSATAALLGGAAITTLLVAHVAAPWAAAALWVATVWTIVFGAGFFKGMMITGWNPFKAAASNTNVEKAHALFQGEEIMHNVIRAQLGLPEDHQFQSRVARAADEIFAMTGGFILLMAYLPIILATALANLALPHETKINNDLVNALKTIRQLANPFPPLAHQMSVTADGVLIRFGLRKNEEADDIRKRLLEPVQMSA